MGRRRDDGDVKVPRQRAAKAHAVAERLAYGRHFKLEDRFGIVRFEAAGEAFDGKGLARALHANLGTGGALPRDREGEED